MYKVHAHVNASRLEFQTGAFHIGIGVYVNRVLKLSQCHAIVPIWKSLYTCITLVQGTYEIPGTDFAVYWISLHTVDS